MLTIFYHIVTENTKELSLYKNDIIEVVSSFSSFLLELFVFSISKDYFLLIFSYL